jgi:hypothetical protein
MRRHSTWRCLVTVTTSAGRAQNDAVSKTSTAGTPGLTVREQQGRPGRDSGHTAPGQLSRQGASAQN